MTYFETIVGACIVVAVVYLFLKHKKEMAQLDKENKINCTKPWLHNFPNLKADTKCTWCGRSIKQLEEEMKR